MSSDKNTEFSFKTTVAERLGEILRTGEYSDIEFSVGIGPNKEKVILLTF